VHGARGDARQLSPLLKSAFIAQFHADRYPRTGYGNASSLVRRTAAVHSTVRQHFIPNIKRRRPSDRPPVCMQRRPPVRPPRSWQPVEHAYTSRAVGVGSVLVAVPVPFERAVDVAHVPHDVCIIYGEAAKRLAHGDFRDVSSIRMLMHVFSRRRRRRCCC
jgi:hypothetical protein